MLDKKKSPMLYQANPLIESRKPLNTLEMRLFLLAVQNINPHISAKDKYYDKDFKELHLTPGEVKEIFGNGAYLNRLEKVCTGMAEKVVTLKDEKGNFAAYPVFEAIEYKPRKGLYICFNNRMRPFLLDIYESGQGYTKVSMKQIFNLSSAYAMRLLELMLQYKGTMKDKLITRYISLSDLRFLLDIKENEYHRISDLRRFVLDGPIREINNKTQYELSYVPQKKGRKIVGFTFSMDCSQILPDEAITQTLVLEKTPAKKEWHGLSVGAVNKLTTLCGSNEEFKRRMDYAVSLLPKRKPQNPQAFLYKAIEENYLQQELDMQAAIQKEMKAQAAAEEWKATAKERFHDAIELEDGAQEIPFDTSDAMQKAMVSVIKTALKRRELDITSKRLLTEHGYTVARFIDVYCD